MVLSVTNALLTVGQHFPIVKTPFLAPLTFKCPLQTGSTTHAYPGHQPLPMQRFPPTLIRSQSTRMGPGMSVRIDPSHCIEGLILQGSTISGYCSHTPQRLFPATASHYKPLSSHDTHITYHSAHMTRTLPTTPSQQITHQCSTHPACITATWLHPIDSVRAITQLPTGLKRPSSSFLNTPLKWNAVSVIQVPFSKCTFGHNNDLSAAIHHRLKPIIKLMPNQTKLHQRYARESDGTQGLSNWL